jgi:MFS family permease
LLPVLFPGLIALFISAPAIGVAFMLFQVAVQNATGELGGPEMRSQNFGALALGYSISGFLGPLIAGFTIDHGGYTATYAVLAAIPLVPTLVLARGMHALPGPHPAHRRENAGNVMELLTHKKLQAVFLVNVLLSAAWDLHTIVIPIYGAKIGLTASQIGVTLASFAAATFIVRLAMRWIIRRFNEQQVLTCALFFAAIVYLLFPFSQGAATLMVLSFMLGLGLGMSQPMVMSLLHSHAPPGRMGEAAGSRMSLVNSMSVAVPLAFGALGGTVGLAPVFWSVGVCLATGGWLTGKAPR